MVKVGGAVLTDKARVRVLDVASVRRLAVAARRARPALLGRLVLVLGGGSFGHRIFLEHDLAGGARVHEDATARAVNDEFAAHARLIVDELAAEGLPARAVGLQAGAGPLTARAVAGTVRRRLRQARLPVLTGGVLAADATGPVAVSSDRVASDLAVALGALGLVMVSDVPGVLDAASGMRVVVPRISPRDVDGFVPATGAGVLDRTGGMREKLVCLADAALLGVHGVVVGPDHLDDLEALLRPAALRGTHVPPPHPAAAAPDRA